MNENERCPECGSWGEECAFPTAQAGCGCARCLRAALANSRQQAADLTKILMREGAHQTAYEWRLAEALRERDEARAEASRLDDEAIYQRGLYESARAEVERLRKDPLPALAMMRDIERTVAERQREACAKEIEMGQSEKLHRVTAANSVRATPLVTEGEE